MPADAFVAQQRVDAFRSALGNLGARLDQTPELDALLDLADRNGWTPAQIGAWIIARLPGQMTNPAGLILIKLRDVARTVRPTPPTQHAVDAAAAAKPGTFRQPKDPCGTCDGSPARWLDVTPEGHQGQAILRHCPFCWTRPPGYQSQPVRRST